MPETMSHPKVLIDSLWTRDGLARDFTLVLGGSLFIAAAAQLRIALPFTPVPLTGQTFAVLLLGALYGAKRGAATAMSYLMLGIMGLPVFSAAPPGPAALVSPTAGYLAGFVAAAWVTGSLSERGWDRKPITAALAMLIGSAVLFACGLLWLGRFTGWDLVIQTGLLPFIPGDLVKIALATALLPAGWKQFGHPRT
ncbi:MAG TPA: biotin transporter BioY [Gemmatimonadaceae bacterium]|nr:biotin transporter BioY [Gemmatimonadaceae bacterium]